MADQTNTKKSPISKPRSSEDTEPQKNIQVVCRIKPLTPREKESESPSLEYLSDHKTIRHKSSPDVLFPFDQVFPPETTQKQLFEKIGFPIVKSVLEGFNGTILSYGQTSSGKTYTMIGEDISEQVTKGLIPRISKTIFDEIEEAANELEFSVKVSYCEIYLEKIKDLLDTRKFNLKISEDKTRGVFIKDLSEFYVASENEVLALLRLGNKTREVAGTLMNEESSRSHGIFMVTISQNNTQDLSVKTGKMFLVDLAGSEKLSKTAAEGKRLDETKNINKSLSALGNVICALTDGKSFHIPYRDSKLTRVLSESLGGNSKTSLIITVSSALSNESETISTLRFGLRAKAVKNKPIVNKELSLAELKLLISQANDSLYKKDCKIKWLEEKIKEITNDEEGVKNLIEYDEVFKNLEATNEFDLISKLKEKEDEVKNLTLKNNDLVKENDNLNGKVCYLNNLIDEYQEKMIEMTENLNMYKGKLDMQERNSKVLDDTNLKLEKILAEMEKKHEKNEGILQKFQQEGLEEARVSGKKPGKNCEECLGCSSQGLKVLSLEKNLEQLNLMFQVLSNKSGTMKNDLTMYEKKNQRKNERILLLEKSLRKAVEQVNHFKYKLELASKEQESVSQIKDHPKIKKMIKGGSVSKAINILCPYSLNTEG